MKLYHGTSKESFEKIKKSSVLGIEGKKLYLTPKIEYAKIHGEIILEIEYNPSAEELKIEKLIDGTPIIQIVTKNQLKFEDGEKLIKMKVKDRYICETEGCLFTSNSYDEYVDHIQECDRPTHVTPGN